MISANAFVCKQCGEERYQKVLFIGMEFAFQCPCCKAIHLFYENVHYDINDHFGNNQWGRYVGYWHQGKLYPQEEIGEGVVQRFQSLLEAPEEKGDLDMIERLVLSDKEQDGKFFVASTLHDHFQEAFRALYHLKGHISSKHNDAYNILLIAENGPFQWLLEEPLKTKGIDEIWIVPFKRSYRWPFVNTTKDAEESNYICKSVEGLLGELEGLGVAINKRAGPVRKGKKILKNLLEPLDPSPLFSEEKLLVGQYVGVLFKSEGHDRAGLCRKEQFEEIDALVKSCSLRPLLIAVTPGDSNKIRQLGQPIPVIEVFDIREQAQLFRNNIHFVIGTNCSGCNIPTLYDIPMFTFAKGRTYPDDFYCFARMISKFNPKVPWNGNCEKAKNIHEEPIPLDKTLSISPYKDKLKGWIEKQVKIPKHATQGRDQLLNGYKLPCPKCGATRKSYKRLFVRSDMIRIFECNCGIESYIAYYGLTTSSLVGVFAVDEEVREVEVYKKVLKLREKTSKGRQWTKHVYNDEGKDPIYFYSMKASLGDFYYTLPCLSLLRRDFPDRKIIMLTHEEYLPLVPRTVNEVWTLKAESPYDFTNDIYSEAHRFLELEISEHQPLISNYPGDLPIDRNCYYAYCLRGEKEYVVKTTDVTLCCRLQELRRWPEMEELQRLLQEFEKRNWRYKILIFPGSEKTSTLHLGWNTIPNVVMNPDLVSQIQIAAETHVWVAPHGAAGVIPSIVGTSIVELETDPPWWKAKEPQPLRFGLPRQKFKKLQETTYQDISTLQIVSAIEELL